MAFTQSGVQQIAVAGVPFTARKCHLAGVSRHTLGTDGENQFRIRLVHERHQHGRFRQVHR